MIYGKLPFALARTAIASDHVRELAGELLLWSSFGIDRGRDPFLLETKAELQPSNPATDDSDICHLKVPLLPDGNWRAHRIAANRPNCFWDRSMLGLNSVIVYDVTAIEGLARPHREAAPATPVLNDG